MSVARPSRQYVLKYILMTLVFYFPSNCFATELVDNTVSFRFALAADEVKSLLIYNGLSPISITVYRDGQLYSRQAGPREVMSKEFLILESKDDASNFDVDVTVRPGSYLDKTQFSILNNDSDVNTKAHKVLFESSQLWFKNDTVSQLAATDLLVKYLAKRPNSGSVQTEVLLTLINMLVSLKKYETAGNYISEYSAESNSATASPLPFPNEYLYLEAIVSFFNYKFNDSIDSNCQYLQVDDKSAPILYELVRSNLAQVLIEGMRNLNSVTEREKSLFVKNYLSACRNTVNEIAGNTNPTTDDYLSGNRTLIEDAKLYAENALIQINGGDYPELKVEPLNTLWLYYNINGKHKEAEKVMRLAVNDFGSRGNNELLSKLYHKLGISLSSRGLYTESLHFLTKGLSIKNEFMLENKNSDAYFSAGFVYKEIGDYATARRYFNKAFDIDYNLESVDKNNTNVCDSNATESAKSIIQLGILDRKTGELKSAYERHKCAYSILQASDEYYEIVALLEMGKDFIELGNHSEAINCAQHVLNDTRALVPQRLDALIIQLSAAISSRDIKESDKIVSQITTEFGQSNIFTSEFISKKIAVYPRRQIEILTLLVKLHYLKNDADTIEYLIQYSINIIRNIKNQLRVSEPWMAAQNALISEYVNVLYKMNDKENNLAYRRIYEILDQYHSINFVDKYNRNHVNTSIDVLQEDLQKLWLAKLDAERELVFADDAQKKSALKAVDDANDAYLAYETVVPISTLDEKEKFLSLIDTQELLPKNDIFIRYYMDDNISFAYVVTHDSWSLVPLADRDNIRSWVEELEEDIANNSISKQIRNSPLSQLLPLQLIRSGDYDRIIIVPDDVIHRVPFSALNISDDLHSYKSLAKSFQLIRTHSSNHYYGSNIYDNPSPQNTIDIAVFADPIFSEDQLSPEKAKLELSANFRNWEKSLKRLPNTAAEAKSIQTLFPGNEYDVETSIGVDATNEWLMSEQTRSAKLLHIATHGYFDPEYPEFVGIATSGMNQKQETIAGFLSLTELLSQPFYSKLVVVSGCETMLGKYYNGVGTRSLTQGLLSRGVGTVIGTLWKVADGPTSVFMRHFYAALRENGANSSEALFVAKNKMAANGRYKDPIYWAGFVLTSANKQLEQNVLH